MPKEPRRPRKDQEIVDLADKIRKGLGDERPKSFGLYVKVIKELGKKQAETAFWKTVRAPAKDKMRYFLGILSQLRKRKQTLKTYRAMRSKLIKRMTP